MILLFYRNLFTTDFRLLRLKKIFFFFWIYFLSHMSLHSLRQIKRSLDVLTRLKDRDKTPIRFTPDLSSF